MSDEHNRKLAGYAGLVSFMDTHGGMPLRTLEEGGLGAATRSDPDHATRQDAGAASPSPTEVERPGGRPRATCASRPRRGPGRGRRRGNC
jgi:hypothetical protein